MRQKTFRITLHFNFDGSGQKLEENSFNFQNMIEVEVKRYCCSLSSPVNPRERSQT